MSVISGDFRILWLHPLHGVLDVNLNSIGWSGSNSRDMMSMDYPLDPLWPGVVIPIRVLSIGQIYQFKHISIRFEYSALYNCKLFIIRRVNWSNNCLKRIIVDGHLNLYKCTSKCLLFIIIMSRCQHGSPWTSLATRLYRPSLPGGHQIYILYRQRAVVLAGRPAFTRPCEGVHWSISFMISSLLLQQRPSYLVRLTWIVFVMGGRWPYSCSLMACCLQDLFNISCSILA